MVSVECVLSRHVWHQLRYSGVPRTTRIGGLWHGSKRRCQPDCTKKSRAHGGSLQGNFFAHKIRPFFLLLF
jgi:hypothetical protein